MENENHAAPHFQHEPTDKNNQFREFGRRVMADALVEAGVDRERAALVAEQSRPSLFLEGTGTDMLDADRVAHLVGEEAKRLAKHYLATGEVVH